MTARTRRTLTAPSGNVTPTGICCDCGMPLRSRSGRRCHSCAAAAVHATRAYKTLFTPETARAAAASRTERLREYHAWRSAQQTKGDGA